MRRQIPRNPIPGKWTETDRNPMKLLDGIDRKKSIPAFLITSLVYTVSGINIQVILTML